MIVEISNVQVFINLNGSRINIPFLIDMDEEVNCVLEDVEGLVKIEPFTLSTLR